MPKQQHCHGGKYGYWAGPWTPTCSRSPGPEAPRSKCRSSATLLQTKLFSQPNKQTKKGKKKSECQTQAWSSGHQLWHGDRVGVGVLCPPPSSSLTPAGCLTSQLDSDSLPGHRSETSTQVKKQQLEWDIEQWSGSKLRKEYIKAVYCHLLI